MIRPLGTASSNPRNGTHQTPLDAPQEATRDGEAAPSDRKEDVTCYEHEDQNPDRSGHVGGATRSHVSAPDSRLLVDRSQFGPSNVQLALAQAHVLWAKRHAPHLLEEWLR